LVVFVRNAGSVPMHAHDGCIDHLHRRVMTGGQRIHDPIPDASLPPTNEAVVASGAGAIGFRQIAPKDTLRTRRSSTLGMPRGLFKERPDRKVREFMPLPVWVLESCPNRRLRPAKLEIRHFRDSPQPDMTRTCQNRREWPQADIGSVCGSCPDAGERGDLLT
jgi:hypothetical protein